MFRLNKLTDYGIVLMAHVARSSEDVPHTARSLAKATRLPLPTVGKLLRQLSDAGLLSSHRGVKGGYSLARTADAISVAEIVTILEGPIALTECSTDITGLCDLERSCPIKNNQRVISQVIRGALEKVMLADLIHPMQLTVIKDSKGNMVPSIGFVSGRVQ